MSKLHPFWAGFYDEVEKVGLDPGVALEYAKEHPWLTGAAVGVPLGLGAIALKRGIHKAFSKPPAVPAAATAPKGFGLKGLALAGGAGLLGGYMFGRRKKEEE